MQVDAKTILYMVARDFKLKRDTTKDRLKLQKTIYLLQAYGLQLGYGFSWYKYGPYSQDLVQDAYDVLRSERYKYERETRSCKFNKSSNDRFAKFRKICGDILDDSEQLELVASVDFVRQTWYPGVNDVEFVNKFKEHKNQLFSGSAITDDKIREAFDVSKKLRGN